MKHLLHQIEIKQGVDVIFLTCLPRKFDLFLGGNIVVLK